MSTLEKLDSNKVFEGELIKYKFKSNALGGLDARFNIFLPSNTSHSKVPLLVYLSGLTCTEDNGAQKGGFLAVASSQGIAYFSQILPRVGQASQEKTMTGNLELALAFTLMQLNQNTRNITTWPLMSPLSCLRS